ncbi:hypothetical protein [Actinoplanes couchii]|uniref:DUF998 domain-containing protein n=1 Tax=Actinoplanes couchii TaxID=403638 RepID=A0ABQ3XG01_9ACTN|nr:hypothetical protein [Actinoplanes couchii]MDR6320919.1 hypothetical protein [Actinoplanes couchii]GID57431.1 hypothetical protein Aco03nite_058350 [Actinoplanes couchii]
MKTRFLIAAGVVSGVATGYLLYAASVVQGQLDAVGLPDCRDPNLCWPSGAAMDALQGAHLVAGLVPLLIGVLLGATRSGGWALGAGVAATGVVAVTHRLVTAPYTVIANDYFETTELLHLNHPGFMVAVTALVIAAFGQRPSRGSLILAGLVAAVAVGATLVNPAGGPFAGDYRLADGVGWTLTVLLGLLAAALVQRSRKRESIPG